MQARGAERASWRGRGAGSECLPEEVPLEARRVPIQRAEDLIAQRLIERRGLEVVRIQMDSPTATFAGFLLGALQQTSTVAAMLNRFRNPEKVDV
jgi:hypothetical protein